MKNKRLIIIIAAITVLLLVPLAAMQFTDEVKWTFFDFAAAGILLYGTGLTYEFIARKPGNSIYRLAFGAALVSALFLIWANLAVGLIGSEKNPANLMYLAVIAIGFIGSVIARLRARGMAFALIATAIAQAITAVIALLIPLTSLVTEVLAVNGLFVFLFICSALLFWRADIKDQVQKQHS